MVRALALALSAWLLLGFAPEPDCRDDRGVDRCAADQQRRIRELFGVKSIEEHQAAGDQVRRAFYVDGYGRDLVAIAFVRAPGHAPTAWLHFPRGEDKFPSEPMQAPVPKAVWDLVLERSSLFDRTLAPPPKVKGKGEDSITICLHAWVYTVEAVDPTDPAPYPQPKPPRRKTGDACNDDLVQDYANELERAAIGLFPACAALDPEQHRNHAARLAACRILRGDRLAAAEVLNRAGGFRRARTSQDASELAGLFAYDAVIDWQGAVSRGRDPKDIWLAKLTEAGRPTFYYESVDGLSSYRVRLTGSLARTEERPEGSRILQAPVEQIWVFTPGREYQIESVKVGPFAASP